MNDISLLIAVVLFALLIGKNASPHARAVTASMFGVYYFFGWTYSHFYIDLYQLSSSQRKIISLSLVVLAILTAFLLIKIKYYKTVAAVSVMLFIFLK